ncbi:MAG: metal ABC transporter permease [Pseudomonadota bacterium]
MFDDFMLRAALAALGVALATAPLGCFVLWRRMAYFGDATAHAGVLGVALGLWLNVSLSLAVLAIALVVALGVTLLTGRRNTSDSLLGVVAHGALALGLVAISLLPGMRVDLHAFLFGDVLTVQISDLAVIWGGGAVVVGLLTWRWQGLLTATLNPDLAYASGTNPQREAMILTLTLAVVVAVSLKIVGALLIGALLIIPAATARAFARGPEDMALLAALLGSGATVGGLWASFWLDTPTGPTMVSLAVIGFALSQILTFARGR